jgi:hypothetical protein
MSAAKCVWNLSPENRGSVFLRNVDIYAQSRQSCYPEEQHGKNLEVQHHNVFEVISEID